MDWRVLPDEMFLGFGCPVTDIWQDFYRFSYPKHECGISWEDVNGRIVFSTVITFISKTTPRRGFVPILCAVEKPHPSLQIAPCVKDISRLYHMASPLYLEFYHAMFGYRSYNTSFSRHQEC
ncbi:putative oocyte-secreted protein 1 homolog [Dipodomys merriami]|uniref:putative oocyte-secreted protein 1 homolog n=1 Tax=Dipodomys merriami TaxID=94247 RepID=UPI003855F311